MSVLVRRRWGGSLTVREGSLTPVAEPSFTVGLPHRRLPLLVLMQSFFE